MQNQTAADVTLEPLW